MVTEPAESEIREPLGRERVVAAGSKAVVLAGIVTGKTVGAESAASRISKDRPSIQGGIKERVTPEQVKLARNLVVDPHIGLVGVERSGSRRGEIVIQQVRVPVIGVGQHLEKIDGGGRQPASRNLVVYERQPPRAIRHRGRRGIEKLSYRQILAQIAGERGVGRVGRRRQAARTGLRGGYGE